jgi:hypothetical protein
MGVNDAVPGGALHRFYASNAQISNFVPRPPATQTDDCRGLGHLFAATASARYAEGASDPPPPTAGDRAFAAWDVVSSRTERCGCGLPPSLFLLHR